VDLEDVYRSVSAGLLKLNQGSTQNEQQIAALAAVVNQLVEVLIAKGVLATGHRRVFEKAAAHGVGSSKPKVRLRVVEDKYRVPSADIDCAERFPLCHARCCAFSFELSKQDLEEGTVRWEIEEPYVIRHEPDGFCSHLDRQTLFCTIHAQRPATCRGYDCRGDQRVWLDFEARIPAPMPMGLLPIRRPLTATPSPALTSASAVPDALPKSSVRE